MKRSCTWPDIAQNDPPQQWRGSGNLQRRDSGSAQGEVAEKVHTDKKLSMCKTQECRL